MEDKLKCHCGHDHDKEESSVQTKGNCHCGHDRDREEGGVQTKGNCHCGHDHDKEESSVQTKGNCHCGQDHDKKEGGVQTKESCHCGHDHDKEEASSESTEEHSCCSHNLASVIKHNHKADAPCGCGGAHKEVNKSNIIKDIIILSVSLVFLVLGYFNWHKIGFDAFYYVNPAWVAIILCGIPIFISAVKSIMNKKITASVLITVAIVCSVSLEITGFFVNLGDGHGHSYVFAGGEVAFLMGVGQFIESITVKKTRSGIERLVSLIPKEAFVKTSNGLEKRALSDIKIGDIVVAKAGEMIAVDGVIISGSSSIDQSSVTGEFLPVDAIEGDKVFGGTFNKTGIIEIEVTKLLKDMTVAKMAELASEAEGKKAPISRTADKWASIIVPMAILCAFIVGLVAAFAFEIGVVQSIIRAITVLIVFCPCSLALATPTAIAAGLGNSARNGVLIKSGESLENMSHANIICFDKTGTLTTGEIVLSDVTTVDIDENQLISIVASVEMYSEHPLATAVMKKVNSKKLAQANDVKILQGIGASGVVDGENVLICNYKYALNNGYDVNNINDKANAYFAQGKTVVTVIINDKVAGVLGFSDTVREQAKQAIATIKNKGYRVIMLTGDNQSSAEYIAQKCGIEEIHHSLLPEDKLRIVEELSKNGKVCMIGDGINDAPSLKASSVSMAFTSLGSDIAVESADMAILSNNLKKVQQTLSLSKRTLSTIKRNIIFSIIINVFAVVASMMGWLTPVTGALVHNFTSVFVVLSSALLLRKKSEKQ